ncbi:hypothetical protein SpCBS45565_g02816 [Spizellomyces sp. 'palustris']|nr:hypothetical protein SpCBS45565_g02816 [Spizellomyces sp. 'palustris']
MPTCDHFYKALLTCLLKSPCVVEQRNTPRECLNPKYDENSVSPECRLAQRAYVECKTSIMNPRKRFRGPYGGRPPKEEDEEEI